METRVISHGQASCPIAEQSIQKHDRVEGAACPFCSVTLPPKNRRLLVAVDDDNTVLTSKLSSGTVLWRHPLFIIFVTFLAVMIAAAVVGRF